MGLAMWQYGRNAALSTAEYMTPVRASTPLRSPAVCLGPFRRRRPFRVPRARMGSDALCVSVRARGGHDGARLAGPC